jgi:hypothetical protein
MIWLSMTDAEFQLDGYWVCAAPEWSRNEATIILPMGDSAGQVDDSVGAGRRESHDAASYCKIPGTVRPFPN